MKKLLLIISASSLLYSCSRPADDCCKYANRTIYDYQIEADSAGLHIYDGNKEIGFVTHEKGGAIDSLILWDNR